MPHRKPKSPQSKDAAPAQSAKPRGERAPSGRVQFDERGNAIWEWALSTGAFGRDVSSQRLRRLEHPALSIAQDAPTPSERVVTNPHGVVRGYDPYDSGRLDKTARRRKKDLRKLSEWIALKKSAADNDD